MAPSTRILPHIYSAIIKFVGQLSQFLFLSHDAFHIMSTVASSGAGVPVTTTLATAASAAHISASASTSASSSVTPPTLATPAGTSLLTPELQNQIQTMVQAAIAAALPTTSAPLPTTGPAASGQHKFLYILPYSSSVAPPLSRSPWSGQGCDVVMSGCQ